MKKVPQLYKFSEIKHRLQTLEPGKSYIKPFVTSKVSDTMCGGLNFLNKVSVPWDLTCDEKCVIFYAAYPHDWKQKAGITFVPGIDPEDMPKVDK